MHAFWSAITKKINGIINKSKELLEFSFIKSNQRLGLFAAYCTFLFFVEQAGQKF